MSNNIEKKPAKLPKQLSEIQDIRESLATPQKSQYSLWIILLIVAVILLVIGAIFQVFTPQKIEVPTSSFVYTNANNTVSNISEISFSGTAPDLPAEMPLLRADQVLSQTEVIMDINTRYGLMKTDPNNDYWVNGSLILLQDQSDKTFTLILKEPQNEQLPIVNTESAQEIATNYIRELFPDLQLVVIPNATTYLNLSMETDLAESPDVATAAQFAFTPQIDTGEFPVFYEKNTRFPFTVTVDGKNAVRMLKFFPLFKQYITIGTLPPISVDKAIEQMKNGKASIVSASSFDPVIVSVAGISSAQFQSVDVQYREDPEVGLVYPFYHFVGTGVDQRGIQADIQVITPAIETLAISGQR